MKDTGGNFSFTIKKGFPEAKGASVSLRGTNFAIAVKNDKECSLLLYKKGNSIPSFTIPFTKEYKVGDMYSMFIEKFPAKEYEYNFLIEGKVIKDPYAKEIIGKEQWGKPVKSSEIRCGFSLDDFDWKGDKPLCIPYHEVIMYNLHTRGYTKHASSKVKEKGTFQGIIEKISYLKELGINQVEFMPVYEFSELPIREENIKSPIRGAERLNYWGYTSGFYFSPKKAYISDGRGNEEFKELVRTFHENKIEVILEFYFPKGTPYGLMIDCLHYWVLEYHVDGFHINSDIAPVVAIASDPLLSKTKIMCAGLDINQVYEEKERPSFIHLADYDEGFLVTMRRFLKGDENLLNQVTYRVLRNSRKQAVINYIANHNGFTLMDAVSYETKCNEENGQKNRDGTDYNYSWNCGVEGETRGKKVLLLRKKQIRNALLFVILSQGVPLLYQGDEMGNSQKGNNNPYCQDNDISWINWKDKEKHQDIFTFTKGLIEFRKNHPLLHKKQELSTSDDLICGYPEVSLHGEEAWYGDDSFYKKSVGIMYCGMYAKKENGSHDDFLYFAYNMNWKEEKFALPTLPKNMMWRLAIDTGDREERYFYREEEPVLEDQKYLKVEPRTIIVVIGK